MASFVLHGDTDEGIDPDKLHLHILAIVRHPLTLHQLLHHDGVDGIVLDCVVRGGTLLPSLVVGDALNLQNAGLLEAPVS